MLKLITSVIKPHSNRRGFNLGQLSLALFRTPFRTGFRNRGTAVSSITACVKPPPIRESVLRAERPV
jgi:hypothetical protein